MNAMLANYHFLTRNYGNALDELREVLRLDPAETKARKKLIICLTQTGHLAEAVEEFWGLISDDIRSVIETDAAWEDCPCPGLVTRLEQGVIRRENEGELMTELGILWLYCDAHASLNYFRRAREFAPDDKLLSAIIQLIESHLNII